MAATRPSAAPTNPKQKYARSDENNLNLPEILAKYPQKIMLACPPGMDAERMLRVALTAFYRTPALWDCDPVSIAGAIVQAAMLGLEVDGVTGLAYLVPFWNNKVTPRRRECQMIPGYKGFILLGRRSGEVLTTSAEMVHQADDFAFGEGVEPYIRHTPYILRREAGNLMWACVSPEDRGDIVAVYSVLKLKDSSHQQKVMGLPEVFRIRDNFSKAQNDEGQIVGPWADHEDWMVKKTCIKQLYKLAPLSSDVRMAVALDDRTDAGLSQDLAGLILDVTNDRPAQPRGPIPLQNTAGAASAPPEAANGPQGGGAQGPGPGQTASSASRPPASPERDPEANPDPTWDDAQFTAGAPGQQQQQAPPRPLTVEAFSQQELQQLQFKLRNSRVAVNRAQVESWLATRFTAGQKDAAVAEADRLAKGA